MSSQMRLRFSVSFVAFFIASLFPCGALTLEPMKHPKAPFKIESIKGQKVWVPTSKTSLLYFDVPANFAFKKDQNVYLKVTYYDEGHGLLKSRYDSTASHLEQAEIHMRSSRVGTLKFVESYQVFKKPNFKNRHYQKSDFSITLSFGSGSPLKISKVEISAVTPKNDRLRYILSEPWLQPYKGPSKDFVDAKTLKGKVLSGYQGWFKAPNDFADLGWNHWSFNGKGKNHEHLSPTNITIDMWPYMKEYDRDNTYPAKKIKLKSGKSARVFSSQDPSTVQRHFKWMRKHDIDGVYLQRFVSKNKSGYYGSSEFVLNNVREAAHKEGRVWAIEYDISAMSREQDPFTVIKNDWNWLVTEAKILEDSRYLHENGKPVVFIWGFSVEKREINITVANQVIDWFKKHDLYLIGGANWSWMKKKEWYDHYQRYDQLLGWMVRDADLLKQQKKQLNQWNTKILPHAWPGFSWANLKMKNASDSSFIPRKKGAFYWERLRSAYTLGADHIFLGMFDEYDEATAIMPMSDDTPHTHKDWGRYIDNEGMSPFWYLQLSGAAREVLNGFRKDSPTVPKPEDLTLPAYVGDDATIYFGASTKEQKLSLVTTPNSKTKRSFYGKHFCRVNGPETTKNRFFCFNIDDQFCYNVLKGQDATIEVEFFDQSKNTKMALQYDSISKTLTNHPKVVSLPGTGGWKNVRWNVSNALFKNRQTGGTDFRILVSKGKSVPIRRVSVFLPEKRWR